jgi:hypothetical protein
MSHAEFVAYEGRHAPLILELAPQDLRLPPQLPAVEGAILAPSETRPTSTSSPSYYADRRAFDEAMRSFTEPSNAARIASDEENLFDRSKTRFYVVEERTSPIA